MWKILGPLPTPSQSCVTNSFQMCANWKTAGSHISLWPLRKQVTVNKWRDSLGLRDEDVPVTGALERSLAGASTLSILIGGRQMCGEAQHFPSVSGRTLWTSTPLALLSSHLDATGWRHGWWKQLLLRTRCRPMGGLNRFKAWTSILSSVILKPCFANPQSFSLKGWACYFQDNMISVSC